MTYTPPLFSDQNLFRHPVGTLRGYWGATQANGKDGGSLRVSVFGLWGWVRTVWVCFSLFEKELRDRLTNVLVSGMMGVKNGGFAVVPYLCRYYCSLKGIQKFFLPFTLHLTYPGITQTKKRNSTRVSLFAFYASVTKTFSFCTATSSRGGTARSLR